MFSLLIFLVWGAFSYFGRSIFASASRLQSKLCGSVTWIWIRWSCFTCKETCTQKIRCELHHAFWMLDVHLLSKFALRQETEEHTVLRVPRIYLLLLSLKDPWKSSNYQQVAATVWVFVWKWQLSLCIASGAPRQARWAANTDDLRHVDSGDGILATRFPITVTVDYGCHDVPPTPKKVPKRPSAP